LSDKHHPLTVNIRRFGSIAYSHRVMHTTGAGATLYFELRLDEPTDYELVRAGLMRMTDRPWTVITLRDGVNDEPTTLSLNVSLAEESDRTRFLNSEVRTVLACISRFGRALVRERDKEKPAPKRHREKTSQRNPRLARSRQGAFAFQGARLS
jgi:hypothetical protein